MTRVLFICCHDSFLHHADIRIDVLLRMSAVLRNHFDDSASDDDTVRNFCNVGCLIGRVDAEPTATGISVTLRIAAIMESRSVLISLLTPVTPETIRGR